MSRTRKIWTALVATLTLSLAACGPVSDTDDQASGGKPQYGGDLVMARAEEPTSLVPTVPTDNASIWTMELIYDTLTVPTVNGEGVEPGLATSWEHSKDLTSWTFHLRKGVTFSNGQPMTSADVKFSLEENQKDTAPFAFINEVITRIETPDDHTVVLHTSKPWTPIPADMALYANAIVPKDYAGMSQQEFGENPIGTGAFTFQSWSRGSSIKLVKNKDYWNAKLPYLDSVTFTVVTDSNTRATQLQSGQVQIDEGPANSSLQTLANLPNVEVTAFPSSAVNYLTMNTRRPPFDDVHVRRAVSMAIPRGAILDSVLYGQGDPAGAYLSPVTWAHNSSIEPTPYDIAAARAELKKSTVPQGFATTILIPSGDQDSLSMAQLIQDSLSKIGIDVALKQLDESAEYETRSNGDFDMSFSGYTTDIVDPDEIARFGGVFDGGSETSYSGYQNPVMDKLATRASSAADQAARKKLYDQMQEIIARDVPFVPTFYGKAVYSYSPDVQGFHPGATGNYFLDRVWLSR